MTAAGSLRAREWAVHGVPFHSEAVAFFRDHHYAKGAPNTSTYRHGLYERDEAIWPFVRDLFGVALWIPPTKAAAMSVAGDGWQGVLALSRLAVADEVPKNGASFLLGRSMALIDRQRWPVLLTYADTGEGHTGAIYRATNWECLGSVAAGDTWIAPDGSQRGRKRGGRTFRAVDLTAAGYHRRAAAKKIKFVHRIPA